MIRAATVLLLLLAQGEGPVPLPAKKKAELRVLVTEILAEPSAKERRALVAKAKEYEGKYVFADLVAAVREGPVYPKGLPEARKVGGKKESLSRFGNVVVGYSFAVDGHVYRYAVDIPKGYESARPHAVLVDPGHGTGKGKSDEEKTSFLGFYRRLADESGHGDWLVARTEIVEQIGVGGERKEEPEDYGCRVFQAFFRDLLARFNVDPDRIYVTGLSQTGFWAWQLGSSRPDRFAGIAPMSAVTWEVDRCLENLLVLPTYVLHGDQDPTCPVSQPRATCARLAAMGAPVTYLEVPGAGHDGRVWSKLAFALESLGKTPRDPYPKRVSRALNTLEDPWCYWLRVDALEEEGNGKAGTVPTGGVDGVIDGQTVRLYAKGVRKVTLCLSSDMLDLEQEVEVTWNGRRVYKGKVEPSLETLLATAGQKADWRGTFEATLSIP